MAKQSRRRLLLFVAGVGAGNTTRTLAWLDELRARAPGIDVQVAAQGRALELLAQRFDVHPLREIGYSGAGEAFGGLAIIKSNLGFPRCFLENRRRAAELIRKLRPGLVVADSDFYCLGPARAAGVPLSTLNSSPATWALMRRWGRPEGAWFSGNVIERADALLQRAYPGRVICPVLRVMPELPARILQIPPIVRPGCEPAPELEVGDAVVVVTGGSGIGAQEIDLRAVKAPVVTYGTRLQKVPAHAEQRGFSLDVLAAMARARVLVVQGGFSSISEAVALRRPFVAAPITGHAEQVLNGMLAERLGLCLSGPGAGAGERVNAILADLPRREARCRTHRVPVDGARRAAAWVDRLLRD